MDSAHAVDLIAAVLVGSEVSDEVSLKVGSLNSDNISRWRVEDGRLTHGDCARDEEHGKNQQDVFQFEFLANHLVCFLLYSGGPGRSFEAALRLSWRVLVAAVSRGRTQQVGQMCRANQPIRSVHLA